MNRLITVFGIGIILAVTTISGHAGDIEGFGGWEGDTHGVGYGYIGSGIDIVSSDRISLIGRLSGSYLNYQYEKPDSSIEFTSPGVSLLAGARIRIRRSTIILLSGAEYRRNRENIRIPSSGLSELQRKNQLGVVFQGFLFASLADKTQMMMMLNYDGSNQYLFSRLTLKREFSGSAPTIGLEGTAQGNDDITSVQAGGLIESSRLLGGLYLKLSGGIKKSWFSEDGQEAGAYAGLSFYTTF